MPDLDTSPEAVARFLANAESELIWAASLDSPEEFQCVHRAAWDEAIALLRALSAGYLPRLPEPDGDDLPELD